MSSVLGPRQRRDGDADTGGTGCCVVYLNGQIATQRYCRRVIAELGDEYRHITYDMRARGRSKRSADYSFEANVRDLGAIVAARGVDRPLLVGWSYGAPVALHWASRNPGRVLGVVSVVEHEPFTNRGRCSRRIALSR